MSAETKYKITAEDGTKAALASIKKNLDAGGRAVETFGKLARVSAFAVGMGGLAAAFGQAIDKGAEWDGQLAAVKNSLTSVRGASGGLLHSLASGLAPSIKAVADALTEVENRAAAAGGGMRSFWASAFSGAAVGVGGPMGMILAGLSVAQQAGIPGSASLAERREMVRMEERALSLTLSVRTAQEQYNDALGEYSWYLKQGLITGETYNRLLKETRENLKLIPNLKFPNVDTDKIRAELMKPKPLPSELDYRLDPSLKYDWNKAIDLMGSGADHLLSPPKKYISEWGAFFGEIQVAAADAAQGMNQVFTDALFDMGNAFEAFKNFAVDLMRQIADALIMQHITGPILAGVGLGSAGSGGGGAGTGPVSSFSDPGVVVMPKASAGTVTDEKSSASVVINYAPVIQAIDTRSGLEFLAGHSRVLAAMVQREAQRHGQKGPLG